MSTGKKAPGSAAGASEGCRNGPNALPEKYPGRIQNFLKFLLLFYRGVYILSIKFALTCLGQSKFYFNES